jgi:mono/diheme cytochrome c family protein
MNAHRWPTLAALWLLTACRTDQTLVTPDPHLERMLKQEKRLPYEEDAILPGGMAMQKPPDGTVPIDAITGNPLVFLGAGGGRWAERIPIPVDRALVDDGRSHFDTFCAACHGVLGDGVSVIADRMALRKPPSLYDERVRTYPPGRIFQTVREGYGLMPSYAVQLSVRDAWGVVAYVRALGLARGARVADLPSDIRVELAKEAP